MDRNVQLWSNQHSNPETFEQQLHRWEQQLKKKFKSHRGDPKKAPVVSVVIPVHNEQTHILPTLESLANQNDAPTFEVVLVVNNSDVEDLSARIGTNAGARVIEYRYQSKKQRPIGVARQQGLIFAQGEYIFSTDADVVIMPYWIAKCLQDLQADPEIGFTTSHSRLIDWEHDKKVKDNNTQRIFTRETFEWTGFIALGNNTAFRKADAEDVGGYNLQIYPAEDTEFGVRLTLFLQKKSRLVKDHDAAVWLSPRRVKKHGYDTLLQEWLFSYKDSHGEAINVRDSYDRLIRENTGKDERE